MSYQQVVALWKPNKCALCKHQIINHVKSKCLECSCVRPKQAPKKRGMALSELPNMEAL